MAILPPIVEATSSHKSLINALNILFEPSPVIISRLSPELFGHFSKSPPPTSYLDLIDLSIQFILSWSSEDQAQFIGGHPRIGEVKNLSALSAQEQSKVATPPDVLIRLAHLNACYERRYPGLRYIIFVNGRTRAEIIPEIEKVLGFDHCLEPDYPPLDNVTSLEFGGREWKAELDRAVKDVGLIAQSRLRGIGVE